MDSIKDLQIAVAVFGSIGIMACLIMLAAIYKWKKNRPGLFTDKASPADAARTHKVVVSFLIGFLYYAVIFMAILTFMLRQTFPPLLGVALAVFIICATMFLLALWKK